VVERLEAAGIANARVNEMQDVWAHPQLAARGRWTAIDTPAGRVPALLPPGTSGDDPPRMDAVPALGEHTDAILQELGYSPEQIATLREAGAI
jgi:crotonobetainyl-CoA:carnitine CoA-transferase CaiB-like acyl-CoA transferase